jgi:hypothetical protein
MSAALYDKCSDKKFAKQANTNLMSYAPASCKNAHEHEHDNFTPQQIARMRCWLATSPPMPRPPTAAREPLLRAA